MTREEKLKLLLDTGECDFIKYIPKENMWKLIFALAYIEDTVPMSDIDGIKAEIKTEINDYEGCSDFNEGIRFGLQTALEIIDKHIKVIIIDKCKTESEDKLSKCRYNLSEDCNNTDCFNCVLDKIRTELIQSIQNGTLKIESGNEELFRIIDKYNAESEE